MDRDFQLTARSFAIPVTMEEFESIDHIEREWEIDEVSYLLQQIDGVRNVDFNGHFGLYIYLTIDKEYDNDDTLRAISEIINREGSVIWEEE